MLVTAIWVILLSAYCRRRAEDPRQLRPTAGLVGPFYDPDLRLCGTECRLRRGFGCYLNQEEIALVSLPRQLDLSLRMKTTLSGTEFLGPVLATAFVHLEGSDLLPVPSNDNLDGLYHLRFDLTLDDNHTVI
jgi:hypothetical protein